MIFIRDILKIVLSIAFVMGGVAWFIYFIDYVLIGKERIEEHKINDNE